ncbi:unnamed protein product [Alopecurus aequalis]
MEFSPRAAELMTLLESRMTNFYTNFQVDEIGRVVSVGDGIARVYGLNEIQAGEMVEFASGVKGIALNLENENVGLGVLRMSENGGDPVDLPPVGGFPDLREEIALAASPEAILSELSSCVERILSEVGTAIPLGECQSVREFTETMVLWHGEGGETLNEIFLDYIEAGPESEFVAVATNLARKFRHAERGEPDTPDPQAPVEPEDHSMEEGEDTFQNGEGPSSSKKRKVLDESSDDDSGGDSTPGESPDPVEITYEGDDDWF